MPLSCRFVRVPALSSFVCALTAIVVASSPFTYVSAEPPTARPSGTTTKMVNPQTRLVEQFDDYHGERIADPYRWLEDPNSKETAAWVAAQNKITEGVLSKIPRRQEIRDRLTKLWNFERFGLPSRRGTRYFWSRNDGLQNQSVVYVADGLQVEPRVLLDPNKLSADGTVALSGAAISDDGKYYAYGIARSGSDWVEWHVRDVTTGTDLPDCIRWVKFSRASWTNDGSGFYYSRYDEPQEGAQFTGANYHQKLYFHKLGDPQESDELIYERKDEKEWGFGGSVTEDGKYLMIHVWRGSEQKNQVFYKKLTTDDGSPLADAPVVELLTGWDADYSFLGNVGPMFYFSTDSEAPLRRVIAIDIRSPARENWKTILPEQKDVLESCSIVGKRIVCEYLHDACSAVKIYELDGRHVRDLELPGLGSASGFGGREDEPETFYSFTNYTTPGSIYRYNVQSGESELWRQPKVDFDSSAFESKQVFVTSKDGTRVPLMIVHRRGLKLDGNQPTILYGYGGFNISLTPGFSVSNLVWLEMGGVYAVANLRGGGEFGRDWHERGMKENKQNVFDDFIACAEWLIANNYTSSKKLAIRGGSNGGLLVGAAMTQRPELFAAAVPAVGVMDMLRFHKFTIGWAWVKEYGSSDDAAQYAAIRKYSPLHNLKAGTKYPATLITTSDHDDRVVPAHSFKFAAALQAAQAGEAPTLIRIETKSGHGAGTPTTKLIESASDVFAFLSQVLEME